MNGLEILVIQVIQLKTYKNAHIYANFRFAKENCNNSCNRYTIQYVTEFPCNFDKDLMKSLDDKPIINYQRIQEISCL